MQQTKKCSVEKCQPSTILHCRCKHFFPPPFFCNFCVLRFIDPKICIGMLLGTGSSMLILSF